MPFQFVTENIQRDPTHSINYATALEMFILGFSAGYW
jgi:hypothetical protein